MQQTSGSLLLEFDHLNQTNSVQYNVRGWTKMVRMASKALQLQTLFHTSSKYVLFAKLLSILFVMLYNIIRLFAVSISDHVNRDRYLTLK